MLLAQSEVALATSVTVFWFILRTSVEQATCALLLLVCFDSPEMPDPHPPCRQYCFPHELFRCLYCILNFTVRLRVTRGCCDMAKLPSCSELLEFLTSEPRTVIRNHYIRDTEPGKVNPKFGYHLSCTGRSQFVNFKEVGEVIHCYEIVLVI